MLIEIKKYLNEIAPIGGGWSLEKVSDARFGDYFSNVAFGMAKERSMPPLAVAEEFAENIKAADAGKIFLRVEAAHPGFLNFFVKPEIWIEALSELISKKDKGKIASQSFAMAARVEIDSSSRAMTKGKKINLEFISANPTGPLTMANGRGGFLGDVLGNILQEAGYKVTREYYINDAGVQIQKLGESVLAALELVPKSEEHYQGAYVDELAKKYVKNIKVLIKGGNFKTEEVGRLISKDLLGQIKKSTKNAGINFDAWFSEYENLRKKDLLKKILKLLKARGMVSEHDGAVWLKSVDIADEKDRVLVKSDGDPTYFLADLAYHYNKLVTRKFDKAVDIWGADHHGYVARLKAGLSALGLDAEKLKVIIVQLVRLVRGGEEVKMSKRKGEFITLDDLVTEVGNKDAVRFFFLMYTPNTHMDFDLDLAKERSVKNPVYYAQYALVRAKAILEKATGKDKKIKETNKYTGLETEAEMALVKELAQLPDVIAQTAEDFEVSRLARYALSLARAFHNFYEKERVIDEHGNVLESRLALVNASLSVFRKLFKLLGISAPEKM